MIDIHHHCLPGVDDGPRDWDDAVALCRMAADEGVETIVATPHVLRGRWKNTSRGELESTLAELQQRVGDSPRLLLGSEYFFGHDVAEVMSAGKIIPLAGSRYFLVEFASHSVPPMVIQPLHRVQLDGWTPIIAHPERNVVLQSKPDLLRAMLRAGIKMQITAGSVMGEFGEEAETAAKQWLRAGYAHVIATDAHSVKSRPPRFRAARARVAELCGEPVAQALFVHNPRAIVESTGLPYEPDVPDEVDSPTVIHRLRNLFRP